MPMQVGGRMWEPTPANGSVVALLDGTLGSATFRMGYAGAAEQTSQNIASDSFVDFQTVLVSVGLIDSADAALPGGTTQYYASGWKTFGTGASPTTMELLPGSYPFAMNYAGARQEKSQNVGSNPDVVFQTVFVSVGLIDSADAALPGGTDTQYYASGWKTFGTGASPTTMELLPGSYPFAMNYAGARQEKSQNVGSNPDVVFQTVLVSVGLIDSADAALPGGTTQYYASGWKTFSAPGLRPPRWSCSQAATPSP